MGICNFVNSIINSKYNIKGIDLALYQVVVHELGHLIIDLYISEIHPTYQRILYVEFGYKTTIDYEWSGLVKVESKYDNKGKSIRERYAMIVRNDNFLLLNCISLASGCIFQELIINSFFKTNQNYKDCLKLSKGTLGEHDAYLIATLISEHRYEFNYNYLTHPHFEPFFEKFESRVYEFLKNDITLLEKEFRKISDKMYNQISNSFDKNPKSDFVLRIDASSLQKYLKQITKIIHRTGFYIKLNDFYMNMLGEYQFLMKSVR